MRQFSKYPNIKLVKIQYSYSNIRYLVENIRIFVKHWFSYNNEGLTFPYFCEDIFLLVLFQSEHFIQNDVPKVIQITIALFLPAQGVRRLSQYSTLASYLHSNFAQNTEF